MSEPVFLPLSIIHKLHARSLAEFGGSAGVRDPGGLEAAALHEAMLAVAAKTMTKADLAERFRSLFPA